MAQVGGMERAGFIISVVKIDLIVNFLHLTHCLPCLYNVPISLSIIEQGGIPAMSNREGQRFDDYRLLRLLGQGTFGAVYAAEHIYDHESVAIKIIKHQLSPETLVEFLREARMFRLKHPHIMPLLDFGIAEPEQLAFLVMPFAPNGTLLQRHRRGSRLELPLVVTYVEQLASALHYAHERRLIHRDVKAANVLIGAQDELLLSDFGIVAIAHSEHSMRTQDIVGTAVCMAPEQILGKPQPASDQYALAIMAYEWLCGTPPFRGSQIELYARHLHAIPDAPRLHNPQLPAEVESALLRALAKEPAARFPTIQDFADALALATFAGAPTIPPMRATSQAVPTDASPKEDWLNKGNELYDLKRYEEALEAYNRAIQLAPNDALAYHNKGYALDDLKRYEEALEAYTRAIELDPNDAVTYYNKGYTLRNLKRYEEALEAYTRALELDPNDAVTYYHKGTALRNLKRSKEALDAYARAIELDPTYARAYTGKGIALDDLKRSEEALVAYTRALELNPHDAVAYQGKGMTLRNLKHYEEALEAYNRAIQLDSTYVAAYNGKSIALYLLKRHEEALEVHNRAIEMKPNDADIYINKGNMLKNLKRYEEALKAYKRAIELNPSDAVAYYQRGIALRRLKRYDEALKAYNRAIELNPSDGVYYNKGITLYLLKRYDEALDAYNRALELNPNNGAAHNDKGKVLELLKRPGEARAAFVKARQFGYVG